MAELARWQWDDVGTWRDFAEQYQAEMEAAFQRCEQSVELSIPPFGTFRMDVQNMTQTTLQGRNPGYERAIRRQARKIELGYFLLGYEGEICSSDSVVDSIQEISVLEALSKVLQRIVEEPEEFSHRSVNLADDEYRENLGICDEAQQFLTELGFELIKEGPQAFLVFMQEQTENLGSARKEVQARLERVKKQSNASVESNDVESNAVESNAVPESDTQQATGDDKSTAESEDPGFPMPVPPMLPLNFLSSGRADRGGEAPPSDGLFGLSAKPAVCELQLKLPSGEPRTLSLSGEATLEDLLTEVKAVVPGLRLPLLRGEDSEAPPLPEQSPEEQAAKRPRGGKGSEGSGKGSGKSKKGKGKGPYPDDQENPDTPERRERLRMQTPLLTLSAASEPGLVLWRACPDRLTLRDLRGQVIPTAGLETVAEAEPSSSSSGPKPVIVEDFEAAFTERLQSGLLRLRDLAAVAPLLDWEKPELTKLLQGRLKSLLEGPCSAWCAAAACSREDELLCGRALLKRVYGECSLEERLKICRELLPPEKRDRKATIEVNRGEDFLANAFTGLMELPPQELRNPLSIHFKGEVAEDHGGPRRDFFGMVGTRLTSDLACLWRRLPQGALAPVPDLVAESSPKDARAGLDEVQETYRACGRVSGLAAKYGDVMGEEFAGFFIHQVARDDTVGLQELQKQIAESEGSDDFRASGKLLDRNISETGIKGLTLSRTITGTTQEVDLVPGGRNIPITDDNKADWLRLHLHDKLYKSLQKAADAFRDGILDVFGGSRRTCPLLVLLSPAELVRIWAGSAISDVDVQRWREVATVSDEVRTQADWFWEILQESEEAFRAKVLKFTTGVQRLGHLGLQSFEVQPADGSDESLPRAMTCANMLQMPRYSSKESLDKQLRKATELCDGFQIL
eukprot:TRINITY_DN3833_c0_g2_i1.p1 TRINITY_DN3833_c0_g2~~TRINITY_DN3833_c0_g2_i1.p1  ORF type:complete len:930 (-),score=223.43 TRINITY_DN3833_c0_g2_i1:38-2770(-)